MSIEQLLCYSFPSKWATDFAMRRLGKVFYCRTRDNYGRLVKMLHESKSFAFSAAILELMLSFPDEILGADRGLNEYFQNRALDAYFGSQSIRHRLQFTYMIIVRQYDKVWQIKIEQEGVIERENWNEWMKRLLIQLRLFVCKCPIGQRLRHRINCHLIESGISNPATTIRAYGHTLFRGTSVWLSWRILGLLNGFSESELNENARLRTMFNDVAKRYCEKSSISECIACAHLCFLGCFDKGLFDTYSIDF